VLGRAGRNSVLLLSDVWRGLKKAHPTHRTDLGMENPDLDELGIRSKKSHQGLLYLSRFFTSDLGVRSKTEKGEYPVKRCALEAHIRPLAVATQRAREVVVRNSQILCS